MGNYILRGNRSNKVNVIDAYQPEEREIRASALPELGLNFTINPGAHYRNNSRRMAVTMTMEEKQSENLRIYRSLGSDRMSVYFTLPDEEFFRVDIESGEPLEIGTAIKMHECMTQLGLDEEPHYLNWIDDDETEGVRVNTYVRNPDGGGKELETIFLQKGNSFQIDNSFDQILFETNEEKKAFEAMCVYCLLLENKEFESIVTTDNTSHTRDELISTVTNSPFYTELENSINEKS